ncbi:MAG: ribonuclease III [Rhodospirillales bacterium]|jgi:ribonuclease-3|nr:ribonuclease III [Rhodospirillales bacterium]
MGDQLERLEKTLGHRFTRRQLLRLALTHSSTAHDQSGRSHTNERLEFLGDRVLGLAVADLLCERFADEDEGALAKRFTALVRREALARIAVDIGLAPHIVLGQGEDEAGGRENPNLLADTCEAVIAALFLDGGWETAADFVRARWGPLMAEDAVPPVDAKTTLQEWAQGQGLALPVYAVVERQGPAHAPTFTIEVRVEGRPPARAAGSSKRAAEQGAAKAMLDAFGKAGDDG